EIRAAGSTYGNHFRVTTYGESHGGGVGCVIDGCPPRVPLSEADMQEDLDRRYLPLKLSSYCLNITTCIVKSPLEVIEE
ncbi:chorismate synthase, partial [Trifolium medium]|nr:chorismate synthase [Trifolium medium]